VTCKRSTAYSRVISQGVARCSGISSHSDLHSSSRYRRFVTASPLAPYHTNRNGQRWRASRRASVAWRSCASLVYVSLAHALCKSGELAFDKRAGPAALAWARRSNVPTSRDDQDRGTRCMASGTRPPQGSSCAPPRHVHGSICLTKMTTGRNFSIRGSNKHVTWIYLCRMERSA
jgi:hypothetical protein